MKGNLLAVIFLFLAVAFVANPAFAVEVERIEAHCTVTPSLGDMYCGDTVEISCDIVDTTGSEVTEVIEVVYQIVEGGWTSEYVHTLDREEIIMTEPTSGTSRNGTWTYNYPISVFTPVSDSGFSHFGWLEIRNSNNVVCSNIPGQTYDPSSGLCYFTFDSVQEMNFYSSCECGYDEIVGQCLPDDTQTVTLVPNEACVNGETESSVTRACDYCNPGWVLDDIVCNINRSEGDGFTGYGTINYQMSNQACCLATGLASDCEAPAVDNQNLICNQGYWLSEYNDVSSTRKNAGTKVFAEEYDSNQVSSTSSNLGGNVERQLQPIVFDIDDDGVVETIAFTNPGAGAGTITAYDPDLDVEWSVGVNRTILGDAGLFEFDARQGLSQAFKDGVHGAGLAIITDGGNNHMELFRFQNGSLEQLHDISLSDDGGSTYSEAASVFCDKDYCYTVVGGNTLVQVDTESGSVNKIPYPSTSNIADGAWRNMPAKVADYTAGTIIVAKGFLSNGNVGLFACHIGTENCNSLDLGVDDPYNVTEIYIGPRVYPDVGGTEWLSPVYYVTMTDKIHYVSTFVSHSNNPQFSNTVGTTKDNIGVDPLCPIAPAAAECTSTGGTCEGTPTITSCSTYDNNAALCLATPGCVYSPGVLGGESQCANSPDNNFQGPTCDGYETLNSCETAGCQWNPSETEGVFFASTWKPQEVVTTIINTINIPFGWTDQEANSFSFLSSDATWGDPDMFSPKSSPPYPATSNAKVALETCSEDMCFQVSGITGHHTYTYPFDWTKSDIYYSDEGGQWFQGAENPFLEHYPVGYNPEISSYLQDCYISDNYLAWGAIDGKLFVVRTKAIEANGIQMGLLDDSGTGYTCTNVGGSYPLQDRWAGLYVDMYDPVSNTWENVFNETNVFFDNDGTWPTAGDQDFGPSIGKHMVCDSDRCLHYWIDEDGVQGVLQIYNYNPSPDVRNFIPQGDLIGADLHNYNTAGRYIYGFAEATDGTKEYYAFRSLNSGGTGFIARIDKTGGGAPPELASPILSWSVTAQGLRADPTVTDEVYYSIIPSSIGANTTANVWCGQMYNSTDPNYALKSDDGDIFGSFSDDAMAHPSSPYYSDVKELRYVICDYEIWRAGAGGLSKIYSDQVNKRGDQYMSGHYSNPIRMTDYGVITAPGISWSIGEFDEFGQYYSVYLEGLCQGPQGYCMSRTGQWRTVCCPSYNWYPGDPDAWPNSNELTITYATFQEDKGVRFPFRNYFGDVSVLGDGSYYPSASSPITGETIDYRPNNNVADVRKLVAVTGNKIDFCMDEDGLGITRGGRPGCRPFGSWQPADLSVPYGQRRNIEQYVDSIYTWDTFKGTTSRLHVGPTSLNQPVYAIMGDTTLSLQGFTEVGCFVPSVTGGTLTRLAGSILPITSCPTQMLSSDVDRDGADEVIFSDGIFEYDTAEQIRTFNEQENVAFGIVDITSDSYLDLVFITTTVVKTLISDGDLNLQYSNKLGIQGAVCEADSSGVVSITPVGITAKNPTALQYKGRIYNDLTDVSTAWRSTYPAQVSSPRADLYTGQIFVRDTITGEEVNAECTITTVIDPANLVTNQYDQLGIGECSIGDDGEFNWYDSVENHNWLLALASGTLNQGVAEPLMGGGRAYFGDDDSAILHALDCSYDTFTAEMKLRITEDTRSALTVYASAPDVTVTTGYQSFDDPTNLQQTGVELAGSLGAVPAAYLIIDSSVTSGPRACTQAPCLYAQVKDEGDVLVAEGLPVDEDVIIGVTLTTNRQVSDILPGGSEIYTDYGTFSVYVDGAQVGTFTSAMQFQGHFPVIEFAHAGGFGFADLDYIRTAAIDYDGNLGQETDPKSIDDKEQGTALAQYASNCELPSRLGNNEEYLAQYEIVRGRINSLCSDARFAKDNDAKYCSFDELRKIVKYNNECYKPAHDYCIDTTYPKSSGFNTEDGSVELSEGSLSGAAACGSALALTTSASNVGRPFFSLMWDQITRNTTATLFWVFVFFIAIIGFARAMRR